MLDRLYVYVHLGQDGWTPAGLLKYEERGRLSQSRFRYGRKYLERSGALALDPVQLPLRDGTFATPDGFALFNGIRDAGPDGWGRYLLDKKFARKLSELEYVAATGPDRAGALAFSDSPRSGPRVYTPDGFVSPAGETLELELCAGAVRDVESGEETARLRRYLRCGSSLGGARPKAHVLWKGIPHLAKFSLSGDGRNEPLLEYATMTLAEKCGLDTARVDKTEALGRCVYLAGRFDRRGGAPVPFVSGLTLTGLHESDYADWSYHLLVDAIAKHSSDPERDLRELFSRMVYNVLVYNNDDHPRNFGFLYAGRGQWDLSPLYDVVCAGVHTQTFALAMTVGAAGKKASVANALSQCERFRLSPHEARRIIARLEGGVASWRGHFKSCGLSDGDVRALENSFSAKP